MKGLPNVDVKWSHHDAGAAQQVMLCHEFKHALHVAFVCLLGPDNLYLPILVMQYERMTHASGNVTGF